MNDEPQWLMQIEGGLSANFFQPDGSSRPGIDWKVGIKHGEQTYQIIVRSYLSEDATSETRKDINYQGQTIMGYLDDLIKKGWRPDSHTPPPITIRNPTQDVTGSQSEEKQKSW